MFIQSFLVFGIAVVAAAAPDVVAQKPAKRQVNLSELSVLASIAGVTALPSDPAARSSLEALATGIAAILPNPSVFSVLETAIPHSLISELAQNPAAASSFQSQFASGSTPGWFSSLPTDVRSYLHTYQPTYPTVAPVNGTGANMTSTQSSMQTSTSSTSSSSSSSMTSSGGTQSNPQSGTSALAASASSASSASTSTSTGGAPKQTGAIAAGVVGVVGVVGLLGLAAAL